MYQRERSGPKFYDDLPFYMQRVSKSSRKIADNDAAILLQNAFPTLEKYIDHVHTVDGKPAKIPEALGKIILENFKNLVKEKNPMPEQAPDIRNKNFLEVATG